MALIEFQDLPNTTTPLTASNLNNNFNELDDKIDTKTSTAYIMVYLNTNTTIAVDTAWGNYSIPFNATKLNVGNKFSLNTTTGLITYTGDKALKITLHIKRNTSTTAGQLYPVSSIDNYFQDNTTDALPLGSHISIRAKGSSAAIYGRIRPSGTGNAILDGNSTSPYTYMLVEEI